MKKTCKQCGKEFELSESEINFYKSKGLELPKRCKSCRDKNKGHDSQTKQEQNIVSASPYSKNNRQRDYNRNHDGNHNRNRNRNRNRNDKSYVVVSAAAVLLFLLVFLIKSVLTVPTENTSVSDTIVSANIQSKQETTKQIQTEPPGEVPDKEQQTESEEAQPTENRAQAQPETQVQIPQDPSNDTEPEQVAAEIAAAPETVLEPEPVKPTYSFRKAEYLTEHFQKHGAEFSYAAEEDYLRGANNVIQNPNALHKFEAEDGDDVYFVESTGELVIVSTDGYIRTYFKTDLDYYNRQ